MLVSKEDHIVVGMDTLVLIDSDEGLSKQLAKALAADGVQCVVALDANEGLQAIKQHQPQVIVLCVELPGASGYSLCNKLKKDPDVAHIPLILTSSQATPETFQQHQKLKTKADGYLHKPYQLPALYALLQAWLPLQSGASATHVTEQRLPVAPKEVATRSRPEANLFDVTPSPKNRTQIQNTIESLELDPVPGDEPLATSVAAAPTSLAREPRVASASPPVAPAAHQARKAPSSIGMDELDALLGVTSKPSAVPEQRQHAAPAARRVTPSPLPHAAAATNALTDEHALAGESNTSVTPTKAALAKPERTSPKAWQATPADLESVDVTGGSKRRELADNPSSQANLLEEDLPTPAVSIGAGIQRAGAVEPQLVDANKVDNNRALRLKIQQLEAKLAENELAFHDRLLQESSKGREVVELKARIGQLEKMCHQLQDAKQQIDAELHQVQQANAALEQRVGAGMDERDVLAGKLNQLIDKYNQLAAQYEVTTAALQDREDELQQLQTNGAMKQQAREKVHKAIAIAQQLLQEMRSSHSA